jgi:hypothetical protein
MSHGAFGQPPLLRLARAQRVRWQQKVWRLMARWSDRSWLKEENEDSMQQMNEDASCCCGLNSRKPFFSGCTTTQRMQTGRLEFIAPLAS